MTFGFPKPAKGSGWLARKQRRADLLADEHDEKQAVRVRDGHKCRWPACPYARLKPRLEVAHLDAKGMGGDHGVRTTRDRMVLLCFLCHQGATSLHSGDLRVEPMTPQGTDGRLAFYRKTESGRWECVAVESSRGVSEMRGA